MMEHFLFMCEDNQFINSSIYRIDHKLLPGAGFSPNGRLCVFLRWLRSHATIAPKTAGMKVAKQRMIAGFHCTRRLIRVPSAKTIPRLGVPSYSVDSASVILMSNATSGVYFSRRILYGSGSGASNDSRQMQKNMGQGITVLKFIGDIPSTS